MDVQKIGSFLKELRKEKGLTQEQLAEILGVAGRTVSRWETASTMPDLSILIQLAEYYDVEIKEILDGERRNDTMDKELKETLEKVVDYSEMEKQKAASTGNKAFGIMFIVCAITIIAQIFIAPVSRKMVAGETIALIVGGASYLGLMAHNGVWDAACEKKRTALSDLILSVIISVIFTVIFSVSIIRIGGYSPTITLFSCGFFVGISVICFAVLRILAAWSNRKRMQVKN